MLKSHRITARENRAEVFARAVIERAAHRPRGDPYEPEPFRRDWTAPTPRPGHYLILDPDTMTMLISTDYHVTKSVARALAWTIDRPVDIRSGQNEVMTIRPSDFPLAKLFGRADT